MKLTDIFETTECGRCGGTGRYSFNLMDGDRCYGCMGSGRVFVQKHRKMAADMRDAIRRAKECCADSLEVGNLIAVEESGEWKWRRIEEIVHIPGTEEKWSGRSTHADGTYSYSGWADVTISTGETVRMSHRQIVRRKHTLEAVLSLCEPKTATFVRSRQEELEEVAA